MANLPYQVAATLILKFFQDFGSLKRACVMVQAEVADRICARPGNKTYGAYTAKLALLARPTGRFEVGPGNSCRRRTWTPRGGGAARPHAHGGPGVWRALSAERAARVAEVIDAAFAQRRKTIRNSMGANGFEKDALDAAFAICDIAPTARAETSRPEDFVRLEGALPSVTSQEARALRPAGFSLFSWRHDVSELKVLDHLMLADGELFHNSKGRACPAPRPWPPWRTPTPTWEAFMATTLRWRLPARL